jgi:hypothetical protein
LLSLLTLPPFIKFLLAQFTRIRAWALRSLPFLFPAYSRQKNSYLFFLMLSISSTMIAVMKNSITGIWNITAIIQNTLTLSHGICTLTMKTMKPRIKNGRKAFKNLPILSLVPPKSKGIGAVETLRSIRYYLFYPGEEIKAIKYPLPIFISSIFFFFLPDYPRIITKPTLRKSLAIKGLQPEFTQPPKSGSVTRRRKIYYTVTD